MEELKKVNILIVDDEKVVRDFLVNFLKLFSVTADTAEDGPSAVNMAKNKGYNMAFIDIRMPGIDGLQTFTEIKKICPDIKCVFMTGYASESAIMSKINKLSQVCITKPFEDLNAIKELVLSVIKNKN